MQSARLGVVVDTTLFVSEAILKRGNPHALLLAWRAGAFDLITSRQQQDELIRAMRRPKGQKYGVTDAEIRSLARRLTRGSTSVEPLVPLPLPVRDVKDEHILGIGFAGDADYLITGDNDLLVLAGDPRLGKLQIVTVADFLAILNERETVEA